MIYPYCNSIPGNIKLVNNTLQSFMDTNTNDEIDIVLLTPYRIFLCEVKAYRYKVTLTNEWTYRSKGPVEKSIPVQTEKHARHFYYNFYDVIPDGNYKYIVPIIIIADKCIIDDQRDFKWKNYIPITNLNMLNKTISNLDAPLEYKIDVKTVFEIIKTRSISFGKVSL